MSTNLESVTSLQTTQFNHEEFYKEFVSRNFHFISSATQQKLKNFRILIAGCGSTGGACIEALARVGVESFKLADNGEYDVSNLNRQHARLDAVGKNKATFHQEELLSINPYIKCSVETVGVQDHNVESLCKDVDLIFDAVDVTTPAGIQSKVLLHRFAKKMKLPVLSGLDVGLLQWGMSFDYRKASTELLHGKADSAVQAKHPIKALFSIYPIDLVPAHCLGLIDDLLQGKSSFASQLGCTSDMLSAIIVPVVLRYLETSELTEGWNFNLQTLRTGKRPKFLSQKFEDYRTRKQLKRALAQIS